MSQHDAFVAVHEKQDGAEAAIRTVAGEGLDMKHVSIVGRGSFRHSPASPTGVTRDAY